MWVLGQEGVDAKTPEEVLEAVISTILLFISETWVVTHHIFWALGVFVTRSPDVLLANIPGSSHMAAGCTHPSKNIWRWMEWGLLGSALINH